MAGTRYLRADAAASEVEGLRAALAVASLSGAEVEEAAMRCLWLARYWGLAARYGR
jgi:hypothetical protein